MPRRNRAILPGSAVAIAAAASTEAAAMASRSTRFEIGYDRSIGSPVEGFQAWKVARSAGAFIQVPAVRVVVMTAWYRCEPSPP